MCIDIIFKHINAKSTIYYIKTFQNYEKLL